MLFHKRLNKVRNIETLCRFKIKSPYVSSYIKQFLYINFKTYGSKVFIGAKIVTELAGFQGIY